MGDSDESDNDDLVIKPNPTLDLLKKCTSAWQQLSAKRKMTHELKQYQELFLTELPGSTKVTSMATHAVLEGELAEDENAKRVIPRFRNQDQGPSAGDKKKVRNHALIHYFATLASSNHISDTMDFSFVESLLQNGASVKSSDKHGQTIFHEVARSWHTDVAQFLITQGADINQVDKFGRAPLHVAAAANYGEMVEFLLTKGADISLKTAGELQTPIHFAAKNDAALSLQVLINFGADQTSKDYKGRTPLQVAAELNRSKTAKLLIERGVPAFVHDKAGTFVLSLLIRKMPHVAMEAMEQFHSKDFTNRKQYFYLNYLECMHLDKMPESCAKRPLDDAVQNNHFELIMHPVFQRLINVKWEKFGKTGAWFSLILNIVFAILWTFLAVTQPIDVSQHYTPLSQKWWRLFIEIVVILLTINEIRIQVVSTFTGRKEHTTWRAWKIEDLERDLEFCHPRWPEEARYLECEIRMIKDATALHFQDSWNYLEWVSCLLIVTAIISHLVNIFLRTRQTYTIHMRILVFLLILLWLRILKYVRPFKGPGPFVQMLGHVIDNIIKWGFLYVVFYIPYAAAFWILFGGISPNPVRGYSNVFDLFVYIFRMTVVDDYNFTDLYAADPTMARILCSSYIAFASIVILNLLIALLSDTFQRVYENAMATAVMQRAQTIISLEKSLRKKTKAAYREFIDKDCSPEAMYYEETADNAAGRITQQLKDEMVDLRGVIEERFGKSVGGPKSDFDVLREDILNIISCQDKMLMKFDALGKRVEKIEKKLDRENKSNQTAGDVRKSRVSLSSPKFGSANFQSEQRVRRLSLEPDAIRSPLRITPTQLNGGQPITSAAAREKKRMSKLTTQEKAAGIVIFRYWRSYQERKRKFRKENKAKRQRRGSTGSGMSGKASRRRRPQYDDDAASDITGHSGDW